MLPLLEARLCTRQQRDMVWRTLRAMPLRLLERVLPWLAGTTERMPPLSHPCLCHSLYGEMTAGTRSPCRPCLCARSSACCPGWQVTHLDSGLLLMGLLLCAALQGSDMRRQASTLSLISLPWLQRS